MTPSVGRIVHYLCPGDTEPTAAVITEVVDAEKKLVNLTLFRVGRENYANTVEHAETLTVAQWCWPPRL